MSNHLASETSPYLLQHANNPVDWYPWGEEALRRAKEEQRPIFLSIGYSACHWCHVMEHESFENQEIASRLNAHFVCIKVDREERPDLDQIYMTAVQLMTRHGGWPMSVFLTPELEPFFGGTYWPPHARGQMPGFDQVIAAVADAWQNRREQAMSQAHELTEHIRQLAAGAADDDSRLGDPQEVILAAAVHLERAFDFSHGGFGSAPKFPHSMDLQLLLRVWKRNGRQGVLDMVRLSLDKMFQGGIYDHLGGGFARYSVDARWLVPHFEKMLYDNALLSGAYLDGYLATGEQRYAQVVRETLGYICNYLTDELGGYHSTEDADSEGEEGKFYVWTPAEIRAVLGAELAEKFCYVYDVSAEGNFEGRSILNLPKTIDQCAAVHNWDLQQLQIELAGARAKLLAVRDQRVRPGKDDKILASWNGLMIDSMARAAAALDESAYLRSATRAAQFIRAHLSRDDGRLLHAWRHGQARFDGYLDDYANLANGYVSLYEAGGGERWLDEAVRLADIMQRHFGDPDGTGFFYTADDHEQLIARQKDAQDSSVPSGNAMAATVFVRLGHLCGRPEYLQIAEQTIQSAASLIERSPTAAGQMLIALDMLCGPFYELVVAGDGQAEIMQSVLHDIHRRYLPNRVVACRTREAPAEVSSHLEPLFDQRTAVNDTPTLYVCQGNTCQAPVAGTDAISKTLTDLS